MDLDRDVLVRDAEGTFSEPRMVMENQDLSDAQKLEILENWRLDLLELMVATDENMQGRNADAGVVAEKLRLVTEALDTLQVADSDADRSS
jgi:hypothetical protein